MELLKSNRTDETTGNGFIFSNPSKGESSKSESNETHEKKMPTINDMIMLYKNMGEDRLSDVLNEIKDIGKRAGYKVHEIDITAPAGRYNPFSGTFDVFGAKRKTYVEKLADILPISVIEEDDTHIRFSYTEKNYIFHSESELQQVYADFAALWESMNEQVGIAAVDETMGLPKKQIDTINPD